MQTRKQVIEQIRKNPAQTLDDITMLKQELETMSIINRQLEKRLKISEFVAARQAARADEYRKQLNLAEAIMINRQN